jgi:hypothetical protein
MRTRGEATVGARQVIGNQDALRVTLVMGLIGACWFAAWPYMGLWHDARLYALEALTRLKPGLYERDLFLAYGSQGGFTIFPVLFAALIKWLGLEYAAHLLTVIGKLLWLGALVFLVRQFMSTPMWLFGCALVLAFPAFYDSHKVFSYGESFATPRIFAEALAMVALAFWAQGRLIVAAGLCLAAAAFHPLMAISGIALLVWLFGAQGGQRRRIFLALGFSAVFVVVAFYDPGVTSRLFSTYDPEWFEAIRLRNPYVFLDYWEFTAFDRIAWIAVVLALVLREGDETQKRYARALLFTMVAFLALSWFGAVVWNNVLITQLQLWRVLWVAQIFALFLCVPLFLKLWNSGYANKMLASALVVSYIAGPGAMGLILVAGVGLNLGLRVVERGIDEQRLYWKMLPYLIVLTMLAMHLMDIPQRVVAEEVFSDRSAWRAFLSDRVVLLMVAMVAYWGTAVSNVIARSLVFASTVLLLVGAASSWISSAIEEPTRGFKEIYAQMNRDVPRGSVVASAAGGGVYAIWFVMERESYISQLQTAGALFSRDTALEGIRRLRLLGDAGLPGGRLEWRNKAGGGSSSSGVPAVKTLCGDLVLDYVVLGGETGGTGRDYRHGSKSLSLFACKDFR